ncbi:hypothetical protein [Sulfuricystis multivorans]|uniref:hypothetical protein n=1 Tax=Sulfuricystis multivorans TaxID=2211108 RepID=UPI000F836FC5|nr:hypothetical protein [Sulfuricystis multivorans]
MLVRSWLVAALLVCAFGATAQEQSDGAAFSLRGFGTLGLARSSADQAEFVRDLSQPVGIKEGRWSGRIDSILGLQANWRATAELELVGQVVSRLHYDRSHNPELMWVFAKWEPDPRLALRLGRIGADFMMLADSRLVGYSYLTVRPPADFFGPLFFSHFDGADAAVTLPVGEGLVHVKAFTGRTHEKAAGGLGIWDTSGSPVSGLVLDYTHGPWQLRAQAARIRFAADMNTGFLEAPLLASGFLEAAASLQTKDKTTRYLSAGLVYDRGPLLVQGMLNRIRHEAQVFEDSHAGYVLAAYRLGRFTPFIGISRWKSKPRDDLPAVPVPVLGENYRLFMAGAAVDRITHTLGVRWDFQRDMAFKLQWDAVRAGNGASFTFPNADPAWNGKTDVLSVTLDFVF